MKIALLDFDGLWKRNWQAAAQDALSYARSNTVNHVREFSRDFDRLIVCIDSPVNYRKLFDPPREVDGVMYGYKAQRPKREPQELGERERCIAELAEEFRVAGQEGYEGDDVCAYLCFAWHDEHEITIIAQDKDLLQCLLRPTTGARHLDGSEVVGADVKGIMGVHPPFVAHALALSNDRSDNIRGLPKVGKQRAAWLLNDVLGPESGWKPSCSVCGHYIDGEPGDEHNDCPYDESGAPGPGVLTRPAPIDELFRIAHQETTRLNGQKAIREAMLAPGAEDRVANNLVLTQLPLSWHPTDGAALGLSTIALLEPVQVNRRAPTLIPPPPEPVEGEAVPPTPRSAQAPARSSQPRQGRPREQQRQMVHRPAMPPDMGLEPTGMDQVEWLANKATEARCFPNLRNEAQMVMVILAGKVRGLDTMTALMSVHIVEGRITWPARLIIGWAKNHPECEYFYQEHSDAERATFVTKRRSSPKPERLTWTIEDAKRAGLVKDRSNWGRRPAVMLRKQCAVELAREVYPEAMTGVYASEELDAYYEGAA